MKTQKVRSRVKTRRQRTSTPSLPTPVQRFQASPTYALLRSLGHVGFSEQQSPTSAFLQDVNIKASKIQGLHKKDVIKMRFTPVDCVVDSVFAAGTDLSYAQGKRVVWLPPVNIHMNISGNSPAVDEGDVRGSFFDMGKTSATFENLLSQPIRVVVNSPRGRISDPYKPYVRRYKKEFTIQPRGTRTFRLSWGDTPNIFTPMVARLPISAANADRSYPSFVLMDLQIVIPDTNILTGSLFEDSTGANSVGNQQKLQVCAITVVQNYSATNLYAGTIDVVARPAFAVVKNTTKEGMLNEEEIDMTNVKIPHGVTTKFESGHVILRRGELPFSVGKEGTIMAIAGVSGYFKVIDGRACRWDVDLDAPDLTCDGATIPAGAPVFVMQPELEASFADILGWLEAITEIVRLFSVFF